jgi:hypothetical protein
MQKIRMLKSDERLGFKEGEVYEVIPYHLDPSCKLSAIKKFPDDGTEPMFNVYRECRGEEWEWVQKES